MSDLWKSILQLAAKRESTTTPGPNDSVPHQRAPEPNPELASASKRFSTATRTATGVRFPVDDVVPPSDPLWLSTLKESVEIRADVSVLFMPDGEAAAIAPEGYFGKPIGSGTRQPARVAMRNAQTASHSPVRILAKSQTFLHPLVQAVHIAFSDHRPLILTPDCIWLTIVQGFGHHVQQNAETLRHRLVRHEEKRELSLETDSLHPTLWPNFISRFSDLIRENTDSVLHETLLCEFSTTTPTMKTAYEVALMDTYQRYFDYGVRCVCGIPEITLEGTVDDWQRMRDRIEVLATYDLEWWTSRLAPILEQFVATAKGQADTEFWQAIYKPQKAYAARLASGWIADLFPYLFTAPGFQSGRTSMTEQGRGLCESPACHRNATLNDARINWLLPPHPVYPTAPRGIKMEDFPSGLSRVPVTLQLANESKMQVEVMGGFFGVSQRTEDNALSPMIHWAVVQKAS